MIIIKYIYWFSRTVASSQKVTTIKWFSFPTLSLSLIINYLIKPGDKHKRYIIEI